MAKNLKLQDEINEAFINIMERESAKQYTTYLKALNREIIANIDTLDASKLKSIVESRQFNIKNNVIMFSILAAITTILNSKPNKKQEESLLPIIALMGLYSVKRPKVFAERVYELVTKPKVTYERIGSKNLVQAKELVNDYVVRNERAIVNSINKSQSEFVKSNRKYANNLTKSIRSDINALKDKNKSAKTITKAIKQKYQVKDNVVSRNLNTEIHAQAETVKLETAKAVGYTHKTWKTQQDSRVRKTHWHNSVENKRIPIESDFRAGGIKATIPGATTLPVGERIRCRCYLIYD